MITVACVYYKTHALVPPFSRCYTAEWVEKLYRGVARNYTKQFRFVCLVDERQNFVEPIAQFPLESSDWDQACKQLYAVKANRLVTMGLDTIITGSLDELFSYAGVLAVPKDPYRKNHACNAIVIGQTRLDLAKTSGSDMTVLDKVQHDWLDDLYPGQVVSYKAQVVEHGLQDARIVYFHGEPKPNTLNLDWIKKSWI